VVSEPINLAIYIGQTVYRGSHRQ